MEVRMLERNTIFLCYDNDFVLGVDVIEGYLNKNSGWKYSTRV